MLKFAAAAVAAVLLIASAEAKTPAEVWKDSLKETNADWAANKHALLKINDAAYIHDGEFTSLTGDPKQPATWHWVKGKAPNAALIAWASACTAGG